METITVLYIIIAAIVALVLVVLQYVYKHKAKGKIYLLLAFFRFLGVFGILLLLINPQFSRKSYVLQKPNLVILADNSSSVGESGKQLKDLIYSLKNTPELSNRFKISSYRFGNDLNSLDSLSFNERNTNLYKSLSSLKNVFAREKTATVVLSDGNQTIGQDYSFFKPKPTTTIYTLVLGDTTRYKDLSVGPILTNKYAFLNNKFPLETYISYQGNTPVSPSVSITMDNKVVHRENIKLDQKNNLRSISTQIDANSVGTKTIQVQVTTLPEERNTSNNKREATLEVIDEKTKIALISDILHPDLGVLKKSIESNEQRAVSILKPNVDAKTLDEMDLFIFYQPTIGFKNSIEFAKRKNANTFIIAGTHTDYFFLNQADLGFQFENGYPVQEVFGLLNNGFSKYDISSFDLTDFPPLQSDAGPIIFEQPYESLLGTQIKGMDVQKPLWATWENSSRKQTILLGEGLWKWRMQTYRNTGDFLNFDEFMGNLIRYLTSSKTKSRLNVDYEKVYDGASAVVITATYFDEAFLFDPNAKVSITVTNAKTNKESTTPMVLKNGYFEADLSNLLPGEYVFKVTVANASNTETGSFVISEFDMENQFVSSDNVKMKQLAIASGGKQYYPAEIEALKQELLTNSEYVPTEISTENVVSLIEFRILLAIIAFAFAAEWFIRKFNGLI
ncbi:VWA domain-containing protein [Maribacter sp. X9]|uniref:VWA domain-containing protein n=1 Tax=Maribacter sp. X9 TaxID=3402159 RepID=UPI003AF38A35